VFDKKVTNKGKAYGILSS